jgi:hypothetical protein
MDFHRLQQKLFEMDPTDPREDLAKLQAQAQGGAASGDAPPTKDYLRESAEVAEGSLGLDRDYSLSDFAALAGVKTEASAWDAFKHGKANYNKLNALNTQVDGKQKAAPSGKVAPATKATPKGTEPKAQPTAPKSDFPQGEVAGKLYQIKPGDKIGYVNKRGESKEGVVTVMLDTYDSKQRKQIQLKVGTTTTFAISRANIKTVNGEPFTLKDVEAGAGKIEALEARVAYLEGVIETLLEGKKVPSLKPRDPSAQYMNDLRKSGAMGAHKDKKKDAKAGKVKHKSKEFESIKEELYRLLDKKG